MNEKKVNAAIQKTPTSAKPRYTLAELLAETEAAGVYPLPTEEREWIDAPAVGRERTGDDN
ncbi:hypothetical protein AAA557_05195 [Pseudomonas aeruginosa]